MKNRLITVSLLVALASLGGGDAWAQISFRKIPPSEPVAGLAQGEGLVSTLYWQDRAGTNLATFHRVASQKAGERSAMLTVQGYLLQDGRYQPTWRINDGIDDCQLDMTAFFEPNSLEVTDLDGNGIGEVSFVYRKACIGGIDLVDEKLFLIEGTNKFPIRGGTEPVFGDSEVAKGYDGPMFIDKAFNRAPAAFRKFAVTKWRSYRTPTE